MNIVMPRLGLTMTEGTVAEWLKGPGDVVAAGEILFLFESDKSTMEYEAPVDGILGEIMVHAGTTVACGTPVARLLPTGQVESDEIDATLAQPASPTVEPSTIQMKSPPTEGTMAVVATPMAKRRARELHVDLRTVHGRGPEGRIHLADLEESQIGLDPGHEALRASPLAAQLAEDLGLDLRQVSGSGAGGRIERNDVLKAARRAIAGRGDPSITIGMQTFATRTPLTAVRSIIAKRMAESAFAAPHVTLHTDADASALVDARAQINDELQDDKKISYNTLLIALIAKALRTYPVMNACLIEDEICIYAAVNIALAVDTDRGLVVPVIRDADRLSLVDIQEMSDALISRALSGKSLPDDFRDGTFTITNLGSFEIDGFTPIINQPQSAILGIGRIIPRPVDVGGAIELRKMVTLSLSFDHRIVDGGPAARFLQRVKQLVERPMILVLRQP